MKGPSSLLLLYCQKLHDGVGMRAGEERTLTLTSPNLFVLHKTLQVTQETNKKHKHKKKCFTATIQVCKITKYGSLVEWGNHTNIHYELREIHTTSMENICVQQSDCGGKRYYKTLT